jgi:hypothetical protein
MEAVAHNYFSAKFAENSFDLPKRGRPRMGRLSQPALAKQTGLSERYLESCSYVFSRAIAQHDMTLVRLVLAGEMRADEAYAAQQNREMGEREHHRLNYNGKLVSATADLVAIRDRLYANGISLRAYCLSGGMNEKEYSKVASHIRRHAERLPTNVGKQPVLPAPIDEPTDEPVPERTRAHIWRQPRRRLRGCHGASPPVRSISQPETYQILIGFTYHDIPHRNAELSLPQMSQRATPLGSGRIRVRRGIGGHMKRHAEKFRPERGIMS